MLWVWLAVVIAGIGGAGCMYALALFFKSSASLHARVKRLAPFSAGACMLGAVIVGEYRWADHQVSQLPLNTQVVTEVRPVSVLKPWTWISPPVQRLSAVGLASSEHAPVVLADVYLLARWQAPVRAQQWFNCAEHTRANGAMNVQQRPPEDKSAWTALASDDEYLRLACQSMRN